MAEHDGGQPVGFTFTETMRGYVAPGEQDYAHAEKLGKKLGDKLRFKVTIIMEDLDAFLADSTHSATLTGTVDAKRLGGTVPIETGSFNLFVEDESGRKNMRYTMTFRDRAGQPFRLDGFKDIHNDPGLDMWSDTTTLFTTVYRLDGADEPAVATGILRIRAIDLIPQVRSMKAINAKNPAEGLAALAKFGRFFFDRLWDEYRSSLRPSLPGRRRAAKEPTAAE
jgi:cholesterol oxidase